MRRPKQLTSAMLCASASLMLGCGKPNSEAGIAQPGGSHADHGIVNLYIWSDYMAPDTISNFEKLTRIKVNVSYFDNNETLEARVLAGHSGFDVVDPTAAFFQRQIRSGAYLPLDKKELPNLPNLDPAIMAKLASFDPGNDHGIVYTWGTVGIGYNEKVVAKALPNAPLNSWRLIFDPAIAAKLAPCGINFMDDPIATVQLVLRYLGRNPNAPSQQDLADVESLLTRIRPYVRNIDTSSDIETMANGDICVELAYNGDVVQARKRAKQANNGIQVGFVIPEEGSVLWLDLLAIPRDAPHAANAHKLINYLMDPRVMADISNFIGFANANAAATPLLDASIAKDDAIYPTPSQQQRLFAQLEPSTEEYRRAITRIWQKFKTGQ